jgi:hypothetical protein
MDNLSSIEVAATGGRTIVAGRTGEPLLRMPTDVVDLIGACFEHGARSVLLYAENLPERFFDLSSGEAGEILQKLRTYRMRLAVVAPEERVLMTARFREMEREERLAGDFRLFEDEQSAREWLVSGA